MSDDHAIDFSRLELIVAGAAPLLGDCNLDGVVNFLDIAPFISILSEASFLVQADLNPDGSVDFFDISPFIGLLAGN